MPLAQLNIARLRAPIDSELLAPFVERLADVNAAAEAADGFIWRLKDDDGPGATGFRIFDDDELIVNLSVWRDLASLRAFVLAADTHRPVLQRRREWFHSAREPMTVCWSVAEGHRPDVAEAEGMLTRLRIEGPSDEVFPFTYRG